MLPAQKQIIEAIFTDAIKNVAPSFASELDLLIMLERPKIAAHGDVASNLALQLAKPWRMNPRQLAQQLADSVCAHPRASGLIESADIAGPGFINLKLSAAAKQAVALAVLNETTSFGYAYAVAEQPAKRVLIEFVSANPTGPLHVGHGRQAVLGDVLANVLSTQGWQVHREFYYNDAGVQINNLALSVQARARGLTPGHADWPEAAYNGEYIAEIARDYLAGVTVIRQDAEPVKGLGDANHLDAIRRFAVAYLRREQDLDLQAFGVKFDQYYLESSLYRDGRVEETVAALVAAGKTYEQEGALWLRTMDEGDDKDRVMRKTDGSYTYFVPDIAYHVTKWRRGFNKVINVQGSDHHGTIARVRAGLQQLGLNIPQGYPDYVLHKMVTVMRNGQEVKLSKRAGSYVTVRDLIEWSGGGQAAPEKLPIAAPAYDDVIRRGRDTVRFFLVSRKADTEFVFDIDLALQQSDENPVYYVQYAHARICSVLAQWGGDLTTLTQADVTSLVSPHENALLKCLAEYPEMLTRAATELAPHAVAFYLRELAGQFHAFYNAERVLVDDDAKRIARLALIAAIRQVLANGLAILGVSAPAKM
ncbi:hypothetical protein BGZ97_004078 [Linnemannia gamsii]|uniref:arginine--tRNA ligase n=1 Tax=Linnemannia gamsii TaxID=64522 RepID=A0A9P6UX36_9FUNG|nr:hypothetical protein BGZ97_004078 [Linnemannia gamsii]